MDDTFPEADPPACRCKNTCQRKTGKSACPCRAEDLSCSPACRCGKGPRRPCMNMEPQYSSDDSDSEDVAPLEVDDEQHDETNTDAKEEEVKAFIKDLDRQDLERITSELFMRNHGACEDYVLTADPAIDQSTAEARRPSPDWCVCGNCHEQQQYIERKCCRSSDDCLSTKNLFTTICLDGHVLEVAMRATEDILADPPVRSNGNFRHYAYKQFTYWQHGRLGAGRRRVIPSCCVWAIRNRFPAPDGHYKGFQIGDGILED